MWVNEGKEEIYTILDDHAESLGLNRYENKSFVGYGHGRIWLFWIDKGEGVFFARRLYNKSLKDNKMFFDINEGNLVKIMEAIENIFDEYSAYEADAVGYMRRIKEMRPSVQVYKIPRRVAIHPSLAMVRERYSDAISSASTSTSLGLGSHLVLAVELFSRLIDDVYEYLDNLVVDIRPIIMYYGDTGATLRELGEELGVSYTTASKRLEKATRCLQNEYNRMLDKGDERARGVFDRLVASQDDIVSELARALGEYGERRVALFLAVVLHISLKRGELPRLLPMTLRAKNANTAIGAGNGKGSRWLDAICGHIVYPSDSVADASSISSVGASDTGIAKRFRERLEASIPVLEYIECPDIVYYSTSTTNHRPSFLIFPDNKPVLVLVMEAINMAVCYNIPRIQAFCDFAKSEGYGYLVTDGGAHTSVSVGEAVVSEEVETELNSILKEKSVITWNDIIRLRLSFEIRGHMIASYVLQNRLRMTLRPFMITR